MSRWKDLRTRAISAVILAPIALVCLWIGWWLWVALIAAIAAGLALEWRELTRFGRSLPLRLTGIPYIGLATAALIWMRADPAAGRANVLFVVLIVWAGDIGAYLAGRIIGGPKLAPAISPGKTWSGAAGGLCAAILVALCHGITARAALVAVALSVVAQAGDLLESDLKRMLGVKDSGHLIPGHGGLFDRLDGMLTAAPVAALLAAAVGPGVELWR